VLAARVRLTGRSRPRDGTVRDGESGVVGSG
jgi:hypothetical protein